MAPILQVALDFTELPRAIKLAKEAVAGGADWLEAGTPLIKSEGIHSIRALRKEFPSLKIVADMKIMDAGRCEVEIAAKAGANIAVVMGAASDATIEECVEAGRNYGIDVCVDLLGVENFVERAKKAESLGVSHVGIHIPIDEQMQAKDPFTRLRRLAEEINIPIAVAGGLNSETAPEAVKAGADIIIVGGALTKSEDAVKATKIIKDAMLKGKGRKTKLFTRHTMESIREALSIVSTPNLSDAMHRGGEIHGLINILQKRIIGKALTVRTYPGDWAKTVEAIDIAERGDIIVIDAGGMGPAVWGELATESSIQKGIGGVVIDGAVRDVKEIRTLGFPAFAKLITAAAGEPKGFGEIGVPIKICGVTVETGDWLVGDEDGLVRLPKRKVVEISNRAMDVLERENRLRKEIQEGKTLAEVAQLLRWEKTTG